MTKLFVRPTTTFLLRCGFIGPLMCMAIFLIDGATRPGYSPSTNWVSELSLGPRGWLNIVNLTITGLLVLAFSFGLRRAFPSGPASRWGPRSVAALGVCILSAGLFVIDPNGSYPPDVPPARSFHGLIHEIAGPLIFAWSTAACFVVARRFSARPGGAGWVRYSRITGAIIPIAFVCATVLAGLGFSGVIPNAPSGLFQRIALVSALTWLALLARRLLHETANRPVAARSLQAGTPGPTPS